LSHPGWGSCRTDGISRLFGAAFWERRVRPLGRRERGVTPSLAFREDLNQSPRPAPENRHADLNQFLRPGCEEGSDCRRSCMGKKSRQDGVPGLRRWRPSVQRTVVECGSRMGEWQAKPALCSQSRLCPGSLFPSPSRRPPCILLTIVDSLNTRQCHLFWSCGFSERVYTLANQTLL